MLIVYSTLTGASGYCPPPPHAPHLLPADLSPNNAMAAAAALPHNSMNNISPGAMPYARPALVSFPCILFLN